MAKRTVTVCDLCGKEATRTVAFEGREADLCAAHLTSFEKALRPFRESSRAGSAGAQRPARPAAAPARRGRGGEASVIRAWAVERGLLKDGSRGRVPRAVAEQYEREHG